MSASVRLCQCRCHCVFFCVSIPCLCVHCMCTLCITPLVRTSHKSCPVSPTFRQGNVSFNVTAPLIRWFPSKSHSQFDSCELPNSVQERERVEGNLLFITPPTLWCFRETLIEQCQQFQCAGVVMGTENEPAGLDTWSIFKGGVDHTSLHAPFVDIRFVDSCFAYTVYPSHTHMFNSFNVLYCFSSSDSARLEGLLQEIEQFQQTFIANLTLSMTITSGDTNAWGEMYESWIFTLMCLVILPIFALCCFYATKRFIGYWKLQRSAKLALFCLFVEAITNLVRAVYCIVDPFFSQNIFPWPVSRMLVFITVPWSLSTSLLIALFWAESLNQLTSVKIGFLSRYKVRFFVILVLFILLELLGSIVTAFILTFIRIPIVFATVVFILCVHCLIFAVCVSLILSVSLCICHRLRPNKVRIIRRDRVIGIRSASDDTNKVRTDV